MACITGSFLPDPANTIPSGTRAKHSAPSANTSSPQLLSLPLELLDLITAELMYPDALALKHSSRALYLLVDTSVRLKVAWLVSRNERGLACPQRKCVLKTDAAFCAGGGGEVRRIMEERRWHRECHTDGEGGCEVLVGRRCNWASRERQGQKGGWRMIPVERKWGWDKRMAGVVFGVVLAVLIELVLWFCFYRGRP